MVQVEFTDVSEKRWRAIVRLDKSRVKEFFVWLDETIPDALTSFMASTISYPNGSRVVIEKYEIRGGDPTATTLMALRWSGDENE